MVYANGANNYSIADCMALGNQAANTALGWASRPCPSQQTVTLPIDYVVEGERAKGAVLGTALAGVCGLVAIGLLGKYFR